MRPSTSPYSPREGKGEGLAPLSFPFSREKGKGGATSSFLLLVPKQGKGGRIGLEAQVGFLLLGAPHGSSPPHPTYIYVGRGRLEHTTTSVSRVRRSPPQITPSVIFSRCLGEALRGSLHHHRHHAIVLTELFYFLDTLLDQEFEGRHRAEHVLNTELLYVRYLDWLDREDVQLHQPR